MVVFPVGVIGISDADNIDLFCDQGLSIER